MDNRRGFLKRLFGVAAAVVVGPKVVEAAQDYIRYKGVAVEPSYKIWGSSDLFEKLGAPTKFEWEESGYKPIKKDGEIWFQSDLGTFVYRDNGTPNAN